MAHILIKTQPLVQNSRFEYHGVTPLNRELFNQLNETIYDGDCPSEDYDGINYHIHVVNTKDEYHSIKENLVAEQNDLVAIIYNPQTSKTLTFAGEKKRTCHFLYGQNFKDTLASVLQKTENREVSVGLDMLLGNDYDRLIENIISKDNLELSNWDRVIGLFKLGFIINSFSSCAKYLYDTMKAKGYIFNSVGELIDQVVPKNLIGTLMGTIKKEIESETKPVALQFIEEGQKRVDEVFTFFEGVMNYLPSAQYLFQLFWEQFNTSLKNHMNMFNYLKRLSIAKTEFESNMVMSLGSEVIDQIFGKEGKIILNNGAKYVEMVIGGSLFGAIPFLIGTIYQIIYDIVNLVINLLWYGYKGVEGVSKWVFSSSDESKKDQIAADDSLIKLLTFGINFDTLITHISQDLPKILKAVIDVSVQAIESFIDNAAEYGTMAGKMLGAGIVKIGSGALQLITKSYPKKPTLFKRFIWIIKQWFNIGCLLGPLVVDIILMFCSGGATGIFSAATKLGKADKIVDAFRFLDKTKDLVANSTIIKKIDAFIPDFLKTIIDDMLIKLWAITGKIQDQLKILIGVANDLMASTKRLSKEEIEILAKRLDTWYDVGQAIDLFAALFFFIFGGEKAKINLEGKVVSV